MAYDREHHDGPQSFSPVTRPALFPALLGMFTEELNQIDGITCVMQKKLTELHKPVEDLSHTVAGELKRPMNTLGEPSLLELMDASLERLRSYRERLDRLSEQLSQIV